MPRHIIVMLDNICEEIQNEFPLSEERNKIFQSIGEIQDQLEHPRKPNNKLEVSITWSVEDIRSQGWECTDNQGMEVLHTMVKEHDANYGVNWATLDNWCEAFNLTLKKEL